MLNAADVSWTDYYSDLPVLADLLRRQPRISEPLGHFAADATAGTLPAGSFIDPSALPSQTINGNLYETDEHPPNDIRAGQYFVSTVINALRNSPSWNDSLLILTYDEHGGFYDHAAAARAGGGCRTTSHRASAPISNPPASTRRAAA